MTITFYFPGVLPVLKYGGTERIVFWLMKELARQNHTVYLVGSPLSQVRQIGVSLVPCAEGTDWRTLIPKDTDVLHTFQNSLDVDIPYINTIEGNEKQGTVFPLNTVFVSENHAKRNNSTRFVFNGLDLDEYPMKRTRTFQNKNYLFLANGRWKVKNLHDCIEAANFLKKNLFIGGAERKDVFQLFRNKHKYINKGLLYYFSPYNHFFGMLEQSKKLPVFEKTDALLWPVRWHEPFGIAIIEAFSQGIPVFGTKYGSLPELIPPQCGILSDNYEDFRASLSNKKLTFDAKEIRNYCVEHFSSTVMADNYLKLYETVLSGQSLNPFNPATSTTINDEDLLPF